MAYYLDGVNEGAERFVRADDDAVPKPDSVPASYYAAPSPMKRAGDDLTDAGIGVIIGDPTAADICAPMPPAPTVDHTPHPSEMPPAPHAPVPPHAAVDVAAVSAAVAAAAAAGAAATTTGAAAAARVPAAASIVTAVGIMWQRTVIEQSQAEKYYTAPFPTRQQYRELWADGFVWPDTTSISQPDAEVETRWDRNEAFILSQILQVLDKLEEENANKQTQPPPQQQQQQLHNAGLKASQSSYLPFSHPPYLSVSL